MTRVKSKAKMTNGHGTDVAMLAEDLARLLREEDLLELSVRRDGHYLRMRRRRGASGSGAESGSFEAVAPDAQAPAEPQETGLAVTSQVVGLFQGQTKEGDTVKAGQILGFVESMSIRHELRSPCPGRVLEVLAEEGEPVEYGQALLLVSEG